MKREKTDKSGLATKKAKDLLNYHSRILTAPDRHFRKFMDEGYYLQENINPENADDFVKLGYTADKKMLSRTFNLELKTAMHNVKLPKDFNLKIKFTGFPEIEAAYFRGKNKEENKYAEYYNKPELMMQLEQLARKVDINSIRINYNKRAEKMTISVSPYAGALLWLIFPPVTYGLPLKPEEIKVLWDIMILIRKETVKIINELSAETA